MRLKKLILHGYKTFASKTNFEFGEDITAIIGPNGSGKSNIADAIRWVLGEQSYSTLRGKKTSDMIFAGSQQRPRAGMAQAIITLDNDDGWLPIDYREIEIGRRAYRSGENEYLINGQKVRLRDITELLSTSGLAQRTYTIIGQGLVDQALSLRAEERRSLFEEAAGISLYKSKRAETLRRLEETNHNLERIHDILAEIRPRLTSLRRQANRARDYEQVAADMRHLLRIWYGYEWEQARKGFQQSKEKNHSARQSWEDARRELQQLQTKIQVVRRSLSKTDEQIQELQSRRESLRDNLERKRRESAVLAERKTSYLEQINELENDIPRLIDQQQSAQSELDSALKELAKADEVLNRWQTKLKLVNDQTMSQREQYHSQQLKVEKLQHDLDRSHEQMAQAKGRLAQLRTQSAELTDLLNDDASLAETNEELSQLSKKLKKHESQLVVLEQHRQVKSVQIESINSQLKDLRRSVEEYDVELTSSRERHSALNAKAELLNQLRTAFRTGDKKFQEYSRFIDFLEIPEQYKIAIDAAVNIQLATIILASEDDFWELVANLPNRSRFFISGRSYNSDSDMVASLDHPDVIGWANELIASNQSNDASEAILRGVLIVKNRTSAYQIAPSLPFGALAVSLDGFVAHANGVLEIGEHGDDSLSIIAQEDAWQELQAEIKRVSVLVSSNQDKKDEIENQLDGLEESHKVEKNTLSELDDQINNQKQRQTNLETLLEQEKKSLLQLEASRRENEERQHKLASQIQETKALIEAYGEAAENVKVELKLAQSELALFSGDNYLEQSQQLTQQLETAQTIFSGRQAVVDSRRATLNQVDNMLHRQQTRKQELEDSLSELNIADSNEALHELERSLANLDTILLPLREQRERARQELVELEEQTDNLRRVSHELETIYSEARVELSHRENKLEGLKERITADLGLVLLSYSDDQPEQTPLPIADVVEQLPLVEELPGDIQESIRRYRGQLNRMGGINPDAPEEYEETKQRYEFLEQQLVDLQDTKQRLKKVIADLDIKTSKAFAETVEEVDAAFGIIFERLFNGGSARLTLTDPSDLINTGVEIVARLPRRREQGLALLSGGERSLTATALLFALLKVSPTPFCVLDEVDAMLDEANVNRFREMLQELSLKTQFILITHNRGTVQVAESVYGISMGSDSASQVVSIKPEDYLASPDPVLPLG